MIGSPEAGDVPMGDGPNPTRGRFALTSPLVAGAEATLAIYDLSGRQFALIKGRSGTRLVWEGKNQLGGSVTPGLYFYRLEVGDRQRRGKVVIVK
jgi:hypothetical protein